jgi:hypothetical protein
MVPSMLISASSVGFSTDTRTSACAARWKTTSGRTASKTASGSRMSAPCSSAGAGHVLARALGEIVERLHLVPAVEKGVDEVRADEPRPPVTIARIAPQPIWSRWAELGARLSGDRGDSLMRRTPLRRSQKTCVFGRDGALQLSGEQRAASSREAAPYLCVRAFGRLHEHGGPTTAVSG